MTISTKGKVSIFIGDSSKKAQTLFSSSYNQCLDRSPAKEGHEQVGGCWTTNLVGSIT